MREQLLNKLSRFSGLRIMSAGMEGFPKIPLASLNSQMALDDFLSTMTWVVEQLRAAGHAS
jgi:hypothetical protein